MVKRNTRITAPKGSPASPEDRLKGFRKRTFLVGLVLVILYGVGAYRAFSLQVIDRDAMLKEGERNYLRTMIVETRRGDILDRNGETLATSVRVDTIVANPREVRNPVETARSLSGVLEGVNEQDLLRKLKSKRWWEYVKRRVSQEESDRVRALKLDGVLITQEWKRFYPKGEMLGQVLGRVGMNAKGLDGLERAMDSLLFPREEATEKKKGKTGLRVPYIKDIRGKRPTWRDFQGICLPRGRAWNLRLMPISRM